MPKGNKTNREVRKEKQVRRLGTRTPQCLECGEKDPAALTGTAPNILCYECHARASNKSPVEKHHPAGRNNDKFSIPTPGNDHRILSDFQQDWPRATLRNPTESPARKAAACFRAFLDFLRLTIERTLGWIPEFLESLDEWLVKEVGPKWWEKMKGGMDK